MPRDPKTGTLTISTLGDLIDYGHWLSVYCLTDGCRHSADIDLVKLAEKLGRDHSAMAPALSRRQVCLKCGGKRLQFTSGLRMPL